jgi:hypothetical protein
MTAMFPKPELNVVGWSKAIELVAAEIGINLIAQLVAQSQRDASKSH